VKHLFLHCSMPWELWDTVFSLFGIHQVMPRRVVDLFAWQGRLGQYWNCEIWRAIPRFWMWCLWRERNARTFEGCEQTILDLKLNLFNWMSATDLFSFSNF
jgi:hypothetical protein